MLLGKILFIYNVRGNGKKICVIFTHNSKEILKEKENYPTLRIHF